MSDNVEGNIDLVNQLEDNFLAWVRNAAIFWFVALNIFKYPGLRDLVYWVLGLTILLFVIALVDYIQQRMQIMQKGIEVPYRLDILWASTLVAVIIVVWLTVRFWQGACKDSH